MCDCDIAFQTVATPWQKIPPIFWPRLIGQDTHFSSMSEKWDMSSSLPACLYAPLGRRKFSFAPLNTHDQCLVTFPEKTCGGLMNFWLEEKVLSPTCMTDHLLKLCRQERWWILHKEKKFPLLRLSISSWFPFYPGEFQVLPDRMLHVCPASTSSEWAMDWKSCTKEGFQGYQP